MKTTSIVLVAIAAAACKSSMGQVEIAPRARALGPEEDSVAVARVHVVDPGDLPASERKGAFRPAHARAADADLPGDFVLTSLERVPARSRASKITLSAWRLEAGGEQGPGAILLVDFPAQAPYYVGEGAFAGWPQEKLASIYRALAPRAGKAESDLLQLG